MGIPMSITAYNRNPYMRYCVSLTHLHLDLHLDLHLHLQVHLQVHLHYHLDWVASS